MQKCLFLSFSLLFYYGPKRLNTGYHAIENTNALLLSLSYQQILFIGE